MKDCGKYCRYENVVEENWDSFFYVEFFVDQIGFICVTGFSSLKK